jgi:hypothetical protein
LLLLKLPTIYVMAASKKILIIIGATGNQGSSVVDEFLKLPNRNIRCLTRKPTSSASFALSALGAEVVQPGLSDLSSLSKGFANINAIFLNTKFLGNIQGNITGEAFRRREVSQWSGFQHQSPAWKNAAIAAAGVPSLECFVYSALPPMKAHSNGSHGNGNHWDTKAMVIEYILNEQPELAEKVSLNYLCGYNTDPMLIPRFNPASGKYSFALPLAKDVRISIIDPKEPTGPFVLPLVEDEDAGTKLLAYDAKSYLTIGEIVDLWSKTSGQDVVLQSMSSWLPRLGTRSLASQWRCLCAWIHQRVWVYGWVNNFLEPSQLEKQVKTQSFEDWLKGRDRKEVLDYLSSAK